MAGFRKILQALRKIAADDVVAGAGCMIVRQRGRNAAPVRDPQGGNAHTFATGAPSRHAAPLIAFRGEPCRPRRNSSYRVCPAISDPAVIAGRLAEVTGQPASAFPAALTERMIGLMRRDLRAGLRIVYDQPAHLLELLSRARCDEPQAAAADARESAISPS